MQRVGILCLLLSSGISILWGCTLERGAKAGMADFSAVYYGAQCVMQHRDPYNKTDFQSVYRANGGPIPAAPVAANLFRRAVFVCINLPTALLLAAPFVLLGWGLAHLLWMVLLAGSLVLAALLMWSGARTLAPRLSLFLLCMMLANCELVVALGNAAGIAVGLCVVASWCFLEERFVPAGIVCMAIALVAKPHDAGFVWLYFLLAGGVHRKRALLTLLPVAAVALSAALWISPVAPHWMQEIHANIAATSVPGGLNDPGPQSISFRSADAVIDIQSVVSIFRDDPHVYNPISFLICGALLIVFALRTLRAPFSKRQAWIALAAVAALSMLPVYHRVHDAKLLLLTVPACAILWAEGGLVAWLALVFNTAAIVLTADIPSTILTIFTKGFHGYTAGVGGRLLAVVLMRPAVIVLLALAIFYLWVYLRRPAPERAPGQTQNPVGAS
ncbi:MAG: glycosyltransferase family 87 protein [Terracidiphilus sp.]